MAAARQNPVSTLRTQSTGICALSVETSEGQDKIPSVKRQTSKRLTSAAGGVTTPYDVTSVEELDTRVGRFALDSETYGFRR